MLSRLSPLLFLFVAATALAGESFWTNENGGEFREPANWSHGVPGVADTAQFTNRATYTVRFSNSISNSAAFFHRGTVTQDIAGASWFLTNAFRVGESASETSRVVVASDSFVVTNSARNAVIEAGRLGTGEFAVAGGQVIVDSLLATNRAQSILRFGHGDLTLLNGGEINLGTKLLLGTSASNVFTWNLLGGTTRIIDQPFAYGTLTLGGGSRAVLNLAGPGTVLDVPGLDVGESRDNFGGHSINITGGARFLTRGVQFGISDSISNSVFISDPGSAWLADNVYLGMHAGSQTYVITNGGVFEMNDVSLMGNPGNRMVIAGANARFQSRGIARFWGALDNVAAIQSGGVLLLDDLFFGTAGSAPGSLILVEGGGLQVQNLNFVTGELHIQSGTGTVQTLNLSGGKNAILRVGDALIIGHEGALTSGRLRVGGTNVNIPALNGNVIAQHLELALTPGSAAFVTVTGGTVNASAALTVGRAGAARLDVTGGIVTSPFLTAGAQPGATGAVTISGNSAEVRTHRLLLGAGGTQGRGTLIVTNGGTLEANVINVDPFGPIPVAGVLQFSTNILSIQSGSVLLNNGIISFRNTVGAPVTLGLGSLAPISRSGTTSLRLINSTNSLVNAINVGSGSQEYDKVILANGTNRLQANSLQVNPGFQILVTNSMSVIAGAVTNSGEIKVVDGTLIFEGPVYFKPGASITGTGGKVIFDSPIYLPSSDIPVSQGISVQFETIASDGGRMLLAGSTMELHSSAIPWPAGLVTISNGIVTYINTPDVPLGLPPGIDFIGDVGLRFVNSSNTFVDTHTFESGPNRYSRLYLTDDDDRWQSRTLSIGQGGSLIITNSRPTVGLEDRFFSINSGGQFIDYTSNGNVGFSPDASGHTALVTDPGSLWTTPGILRVGNLGSANHLIVSNGAAVYSGEGYIGMDTNSTANKVTLRGSNTLWFTTNAVRLRGISNVLEVTDGATLFSAGALSLGLLGPPFFGGNTAIVSGEGSTATFGGQGTFIRGEGSRLLVTTRAVVRSTSMTLGQGFQTNNSVSVIGPSARIVNSADLSMQGRGTLLQVKQGGSFAISNITALPPSGLFEVTDDGSLLEVQRSFILGNGGRLTVGAGATLKVPSLDLSGSPDVVRLVTSGRVQATNSTKTGLLNVRATAEILGGHVVADRIIATNGTNSRVFFHAGVIETRSADLNMAAPFSIGSGSAIARWHIAGATNYFRQGVTLQRFGELTGSGLVVGNVTNGGAIALKSSAATLAVTGALQFAESGILAYTVDAPPQPTTPALLVNQGPLHLDGTLRVTLVPAYIPDATNVYILARYSAASGAFQNITAGRVLTADNLASFAVQSSATELRLTDYRTEDADGDAIQDSWASLHFGTTPLPPGSGLGAHDGDDDGDGLSNSQEFRLGTDPHDSQSSLRLEIGRQPSGGIALRFPYVANWSYGIGYSSNLQTWTTIVIPQLNIGAAGTAEWIDPSPPSARFYRLLLRN